MNNTQLSTGKVLGIGILTYLISSIVMFSTSKNKENMSPKEVRLIRWLAIFVAIGVMLVIG